MNGEESDMSDIELGEGNNNANDAQNEFEGSTSTSSETDREDSLSNLEADEADGDVEAPEGDVEARQDRAGSLIGGKVQVAVTEVVPVTVSFKRLFYSLKVRAGKNPFKRKVKRTLIKDANGELRPGETTAIIGPSGAGKTTLLNILAGRTRIGKITGDIRVNGERLKHLGRKWGRISAYIMQDDILSPTLTPRESFWFSAQLRLPLTFDQKGRMRKVDSLIEELGLEVCAKQKIGSVEKRGVSGGQRKRVAIGTEMITDPSVIFLDEPTSGLDSSTSYALVDTLNKLALCGRTIAATIHSPSTDIFFKFDNLILLSEGHIIYNAPTRNVVAHFSKLNYKCPKYTNPAEFVMDLAKTDSHIGTKEEGVKRVAELVTAYRAIKGYPQLTASGDQFEDEQENEYLHSDTDHKFWQFWKRGEKKSGTADAEMSEAPKKKKREKNRELSKELAEVKPLKGPPEFIRFLLLVIRCALTMIRDPMSTWARVIQTVFLALMVGIIYLQIGDNQAGIQDREGALYFVLINQTMGGLMGVLMTFPAERMIFIREHASGTYSTLSYFAAKSIADLPYLLFFPVLFSCIVYWMVGFAGELEKFLIFIAALVVANLSASSMGMVLSCACPTADLAMVAMPVIFIPFMLFGGFFLNDDSIPVWLDWLKYFSFFKYGYQIMAHNEFEGQTFHCDADELTTSGDCPYLTGDEVLHQLKFDTTENSIWASFLFLFMQIALFRVLAYLALLFTAGRKKA